MFETDTATPIDQGLAGPEWLNESDDLPADLESIPPDLVLHILLSAVDRDRVSGHDRVGLLEARSRLISHLQAEMYADIQAVSEAVSELANIPSPSLEDVFHATSSEIQAALNLTRRAAETHANLAYELRERLPEVWSALHDGSIDLARARVICEQTRHLPREQAREVAEVALQRAPDQSTGQLRARIARLIISIDPASARERHQQRLEERRLVSELGEDGTANLMGLHLPPADANRAMRRVNRLARSLKQTGDPRRIDQIRADIYLQLLTGVNQASNNNGDDRGVVDIRVDLNTLIGLDDYPGEIPGWGPVLADVARQIVDSQHDGEWRITPVDGDGRPLGVVTTRRRPTANQRRVVEAANPTCVFPRCRFPAADCDLDHEIPWADTHRTATRSWNRCADTITGTNTSSGGSSSASAPGSTGGPAA